MIGSSPALVPTAPPTAGATQVEAAFAPARSVEEMSHMQKGQKRWRTIEQYLSDA